MLREGEILADKKRVLHLLNVAGIGSVLAKYLNKMGYRAEALYRSTNDPFRIQEVYSDFAHYSWLDSSFGFRVQALLKSLFVDVIHIHTSPFGSYIVKRVLPFKRVVFHCHGTTIRGKWEQHRRAWEKADAIIVVDQTLLEGAPKNAILLENPVDTEFFKDYGKKRLNKALLPIKWHRSHMWRHIKPIADKMRREFSVEYETWFVDEKFVNHAEMPSLLNQYEYFMDIGHGFSDKEAILEGFFSALGLQALACGCKVFTPWIDSVFTEVPERNKPENVIKNLDKIYSTMFID